MLGLDRFSKKKVHIRDLLFLDAVFPDLGVLSSRSLLQARNEANLAIDSRSVGEVRERRENLLEEMMKR